MSNNTKAHLLTLDERCKLVRSAVSSYIPVYSWADGLKDLIYATKESSGEPVTIIRGLRNITDFEYEQTIQEFIELSGAFVVYLTPAAKNIRVSSSFVRNLIEYDMSFYDYVPTPWMLKEILTERKK